MLIREAWYVMHLTVAYFFIYTLSSALFSQSFSKSFFCFSYAQYNFYSLLVQPLVLGFHLNQLTMSGVIQDLYIYHWPYLHSMWEFSHAPTRLVSPILDRIAGVGTLQRCFETSAQQFLNGLIVGSNIILESWVSISKG